MISKIILDSIIIKNNISPFNDHITIETTFSATQPLLQPIQWMIIYVGSILTENYDQVLEQFEVGPISEASTMQFSIDCNPPNPLKIPRNQLLCVTALLITASYKNQEFIRIGYYVDNQLTEEIGNINNKEVSEIVKKVRRAIISDRPRVTKFNIFWDEKEEKKQEKKKGKEKQRQIEEYFPALLRKQDKIQKR